MGVNDNIEEDFAGGFNDDEETAAEDLAAEDGAGDEDLDTAAEDGAGDEDLDTAAEDGAGDDGEGDDLQGAAAADADEGEGASEGALDDGDTDDSSDDPSKWSRKKLMESHQALKGRVPGLQREVENLKRGQTPSSGSPRSGAPVKTAEIPDELQGDMAELEKINPKVAQIAREDSADGKLVRQTLEEYGATTAALGGRGIVAERLHYSGEEQASKLAVEAHDRALLEAHPDVGVVFEEGEARDAYLGKLEAWTAKLPFKEADKINHIIGLHDLRGKGLGTASEVIEVLDRFKEAGGKPRKKRVKRSRQTEKAAAAAGAVKRKSSAPPSGKPDEEDFSGGFNEEDG